MIIHSLLDQDFYKLSMLQLIFHQFPERDAKLRFLCRNKNVDLRPYKNEIITELKNLCTLKFKEDEISYLRSLGYFKEDFLSFLETFTFDFNQLKIIEVNNNLNIEASGKWSDVSLFEIFTLSIVNEVYFKNQKGVSFSIGDDKLVEKIRLINETNYQAKQENKQEFKLIEFGTRRRFSRVWQAHVVEHLKAHVSGNGLVGTSSVLLAKDFNLKPIGTFAHELLSAFQRISPNLIDSQKDTLKAWLKEYNGELSIALSDIYGTDSFLRDFTKDLASAYKGARHDSGNPFDWGEKMISHYESLGIDPKTKHLIFSDGLNVPLALEIYYRFRDRIQLSFGIGTNLTNDLNVPALNIVMKLVELDGKAVCKISDEPTKAICDDPIFLQKVKDTFGVK